MYIIIGGDGKEYGPISGDELRNWISEGRLNAHSQAKAESDAAFRPLSAFPEFADAFIGRPQAPDVLQSSLPDGGRSAALSTVKTPAIALIVVASMGIIYYLFNILLLLSGHSTSFENQMPADISPHMRAFMDGFNKGAHGPLAIVVSLFIVALNAFVIFGAVKMLRLQNYNVAVAATIVAMLPCQCCCLFGLPFGIWALVVLNKTEVKSQFIQ